MILGGLLIAWLRSHAKNEASNKRQEKLLKEINERQKQNDFRNELENWKPRKEFKTGLE